MNSFPIIIASEKISVVLHPPCKLIAAFHVNECLNCKSDFLFKDINWTLWKFETLLHIFSFIDSMLQPESLLPIWGFTVHCFCLKVKNSSFLWHLYLEVENIYVIRNFCIHWAFIHAGIFFQFLKITFLPIIHFYSSFVFLE